MDTLYVEIECKDNAFSKIKFYITFKNDEESKMYIDSLDACDGNSGTSILYDLISLAKILRIDLISLMDGSSISYGYSPEGIPCRFSLSKMYILMHGFSWYNKFGLISKNFDNEIKHNDKIRKYTLDTFLKEINLQPYTKKKYDLNLFKNYFKNEIKSDTDTIQEIMTRINNNYLKNAQEKSICSDDKFYFLSDLLSASGKILLYDNILFLKLSYDQQHKKKSRCNKHK